MRRETAKKTADGQSVRGVCLAGIISGRLLMPVALKHLCAEMMLSVSFALAFRGIPAFVLLPGPGAKAAHAHPPNATRA